MFDPMTGVAETANTRYEPGPFAEWSEKGDYTPSGLTYDLTTIVPLPSGGEVTSPAAETPRAAASQDRSTSHFAPL
jgi:hypothetical protein